MKVIPRYVTNATWEKNVINGELICYFHPHEKRYAKSMRITPGSARERIELSYEDSDEAITTFGTIANIIKDIESSCEVVIKHYRELAESLQKRLDKFEKTMQDILTNIKPLYEDEKIMVVSYTDFAYLEQAIPLRTKDPESIIVFRGKKVFRITTVNDTIEKVLEYAKDYLTKWPDDKLVLQVIMGIK